MSDNRLWPHPWWDDVATQGLVVDATGERFCDEGLGGTFIANQIARLANPLSAYVIFDDAIWQSGGKMRALPANPNLISTAAEVHRGRTVEEVARLAGIDALGLVEEVAAYNCRLKSGDLQPARSTHKVQPMPVSTPPFYAAPLCAGITYTMGGISIDCTGQVLTESDEPIPGLYAAGGSTGGVEGGPRAGYIGGLIKAAVTGLRAGEAIAAREPRP